MKALVTGGGGFLGGAIVRKLLARGDTVVSLARGDYPGLRELGVETVRGDVTDRAAVRDAAKGCDVVFHVAAKAGVWGPLAEYRRVNVDGTQHVIDACRSLGIARLVYTSSPSVVFTGRDMEGVDESTPYPDHHESPYPATKAEAERIVLAANQTIWTPGHRRADVQVLALSTRASTSTNSTVGVTPYKPVTRSINASEKNVRAASGESHT